MNRTPLPLGRGASLVPSATLDEATLRELWRFRRGHMDPKPGLDPVADYQAFASVVRAGDRSFIRRDREGRVRGTAHFIPRPYVVEGRPFVFLLVEYIYLDPEVRREAGLGLAFAHAWYRVARRWPGQPIYLGGPGYPGGFLLLCQVADADAVYLWPEPALAGWERAACARVAADFSGFDPATGRVTMKTVPIQPRRRPPTDPALHKAWARYQVACPDWPDGFTSFSWGRLGSPAALVRGALARARQGR